MSISILIAMHKPYPAPRCSIYLPLQVGAAGKADLSPGIARDDAGKNISEKNRSFCELTGLFWAWKNLDYDVLGLVHYRRYLGNRKFWLPKEDRLLDEAAVRSLLAGHDIILPQKRHYWIETRESHYVHAHHAEDLGCTEAVLREKYPDCLPAWRHMLDSRSGHICNMFIMRRELLGEYCTWLFDILFAVESRLDISAYSEKDQRVFGYLGERLLDVWVETRGLRAAEVPMITLESQHWPRKITGFLQRKMRCRSGKSRNLLSIKT